MNSSYGILAPVDGKGIVSANSPFWEGEAADIPNLS